MTSLLRHSLIVHNDASSTGDSGQLDSITMYAKTMPKMIRYDDVMFADVCSKLIGQCMRQGRGADGCEVRSLPKIMQLRYGRCGQLRTERGQCGRWSRLLLVDDVADNFHFVSGHAEGDSENTQFQ